MNNNQSLILLGVGGGGCQYVANVKRLYDGPLNALGLDTDQHAIGNLDGLRATLLGGPRLEGLGSGGDLVKGRMAMKDTTEIVQSELEGVRAAVIVTTLGGGTGGGATPELLRTLRKMEIPTLCFALLPFSFEPAERRNLAERVLPQLDENADTVVVVDQSDLWQRADALDKPLPEAREQASAYFSKGLTLLWRLLFYPGFIRFDPARLLALIASRGRARLYLSEATGPDRATTATAQLINQINQAAVSAPPRAVILGISGTEDLRLAEIGTVMDQLSTALPKGCRLDMGTVLTASEQGSLNLATLLFETWEESPGNAAITDPNATTSGLSAPKKGRTRNAARTSKLGYSTGRGRFRDIEPTIFNGEDLDIPTYIRKYITL